MTKAQLKRFVRTRNTSPHISNLQVQFDAEACGFKVDALGKAEKVNDGHYRWDTPHGVLEEHAGVWNLDGDECID